jgi:hypothetical protein
LWLEIDQRPNDNEPSSSTLDPSLPSTVEPADQAGDLTRSFVRLSNLPTCPLDRLSRYEATLWRQAYQVLFTLQCLDRCKPWKDEGCVEPGASPEDAAHHDSIDGTAQEGQTLGARRA